MSAKPAAARAALVTGAARGLGLAIAQALLYDFTTVIVTDIDALAVERTAAALGERCIAMAMDVRESADVERVFQAAIARVGAIDALVSNAGLVKTAQVVDCTDDDFDAVIGTNLRGTFACCRAFARHRLARGGGGAIVNVSSAAARSARPGAAAYSSSKAGIAMLTRTLAMELGPHGIRVNAVEPGLIAVRDPVPGDTYRDRYVAMVPLGRVGTPQDVSGVVRFLLSDAAAYVNGASLPVDGGFLAGRPLERHG